MRAAVEQRDAEPLAGADRDVGTPLAGRGDQGQGQQITGGDHGRAPRVRPVSDHGEFGGRRQPTTGPGGLDDDRERVGRVEGVQERAGRQHHRDAQRVGPGPDHGDGLRQGVGVKQHRLACFGRPAGQRHGLGHGRCLVEQARAGDRQPGQIRDNGLEVQQGLQPALADLRLIRRVRGVPGRVLQHVAPDHRRGDRAVVAQTDHRGGRPVPGGERRERPRGLGLGQRGRQLQRLARPDRARHRGIDQFVQIGEAEVVQHPRPLGRLRSDMPASERAERGMHPWSGGDGRSWHQQRLLTELSARRGPPGRQPAARACLRCDNSSVRSTSVVGCTAASACSAGSSDRVPSMSRQTPPSAIPNTP